MASDPDRTTRLPISWPPRPEWSETARLRAIPYAEYLRTPHWRAIRAAVIESQAGRCGFCAKKFESNSDLDVHHRKGRYESRGRETAVDVIALCRPCHRQLHPGWDDQRLTTAEWRARRAAERHEREALRPIHAEPDASTKDDEPFDPYEWWVQQVGDWPENVRGLSDSTRWGNSEDAQLEDLPAPTESEEEPDG